LPWAEAAVKLPKAHKYIKKNSNFSIISNMNLIVNNNPIIKLSTPIYKVNNGSQGEMRKNFIVLLNLTIIINP
jgi:hypothetical protein